jgi:hypothetical protein
VPQFLVVTSFLVKPSPRRQILLYSPRDDSAAARTAAATVRSTPELRATELPDVAELLAQRGRFAAAFEQLNVRASRKQLIPIIDAGLRQ